MRSINRVVLVCGLTRDPKLSHTPSGASVVTLRVVFTTGRSIGGEWHEKHNYIDVEVWGSQAENAADYLAKGRQIAVDGRLEWGQYEASDGRRQQVHKVVAESIQYLPARPQARRDVVTGDAAVTPNGQIRRSNRDDDAPLRPATP